MRDHKTQLFLSPEEKKETDDPSVDWADVMRSGYQRVILRSGEHAWDINPYLLSDRGIRTKRDEALIFMKDTDVPRNLWEIITRLNTTATTKPTRGFVDQEEEAVELAQAAAADAAEAALAAQDFMDAQQTQVILGGT